MALIIEASLICNKCNSTTVSLASADAPIPEGWMKHSGYSIISGSATIALLAHYCPACIVANGTRSLIKTTADNNSDLT